MKALISEAHRFYLEYWNDYPGSIRGTIEKMALDYCISEEMTKCIVQLGRVIHHESLKNEICN